MKVSELEGARLAANQYRCDQCGGVFEKGVSDEDARAESVERFPGVPQEEMAIVCDDCHHKIMRWARGRGRVRG